MSKYVIFTDSAADLSQELAEELGVKVMPLTAIIDGVEYEHYPDCRNLSLNDFYAKIKSGSKTSTSAVNAATFEEGFEEELKNGNDVICLSFSSALSVTYQNAKNAAEELSERYPGRKVTVVDTLCASMGQSLLIYLCVQKQKAGATYEEVVDYAENTKLNIIHEFTIDDLGHLKRGGRISTVTAIAGTILGMKPMLHVSVEGKLVPVGKVRGRKASISALANEIIKKAIDKDETPVFISHGNCEEEANLLADIVKEKLPDKMIKISSVGPVVGSHSGPGTLAIFCVASSRE